MLKKLIVFTLVLVLLLCICSCKDKRGDLEPYEEIPVNLNISDDSLRNTVLYYEDESGYLVPVMSQIEWVEGIGKAAVDSLKSDAQNNISLSEKGLLPILSIDANVSLSIKEGVGFCNLSSDSISAANSISEKNKVDAVVNTLCEFESIDSVQLMFDGEIIESLEHGTYVKDPLFAGDLNIETTAEATVLGENKALLYFENKNTGMIVPITRPVMADVSEFTVMNELLRGPKQDSGLNNIFPEGTKLLDIKVTDEGVLIIDLSKEASELKKTPEKEKLMLMIIYKTFEQFDNIDNVRILINGKEYLDSAKQTMANMEFINYIE